MPEGTNLAHPMAPCGSCPRPKRQATAKDEMIMNENVQPCRYREITSITTNERDDLPPRALDGPGLQNRCANCWVANAQQSVFVP
jgi:hypothetical protein